MLEAELLSLWLPMVVCFASPAHGAHLQAAQGWGTLYAVPWRTEGAAEGWSVK